MLQPNLSLAITISVASQKQTLATSLNKGRLNSNPTKIRFTAVTSSLLIDTKEAVQSE
jgi:hypothetical protein